MSLKSRLLRIAFIFILVVMSNTIFGQNQSELTRVIVQFDVGFTPEGALATTAAQNAQRSEISTARLAVLRTLRSTPNAVSQVSAAYETIPFMGMAVNASARRALENNPNVISVQDSEYYYKSTTSAFNVTGVYDTWNAGIDGDGQVIAILDTGVDFTHPALSGKNVAEACFSYTGSGTYSICPNNANTQYGTGASAPTNCFSDYCHHGTHVAATAAGNDVGGHGSYSGGVAINANIVGVQVFSLLTNFADVVSWDEDQILALEWIYNTARHSHNIVAVNMSLGGGSYTSACDNATTNLAAMKAVIDNLRSVGIAVIIASGNGSQTNAISAPSCISTAISVGATTDADAVASFSNSASMLDLLAPGVTITAPIPGSSYGTWEGTSMATPHVAGAWALLSEAYPYASVTEILQMLKATGTYIYDAKSGVSTARINIFDTMPENLPPNRVFDTTVNEQAVLAALIIGSESTDLEVFLLDIDATWMKVYVRGLGIDGIAYVNLTTGGDRILEAEITAVTNVNDGTPSTAYITLVRNTMPAIMADALSELFSDMSLIEYVQMADGRLNVWNVQP